MSDLGERGSPVHRIRVALSRFLIEFQSDLNALEKSGLSKPECDDVKRMLQDAIAVFEGLSGGPGTPFAEVAKHFRKYATRYAIWNGHEGNDPGLAAQRRKELALLAERRRALFRKFSKRQKEMHETGQLQLPFVTAIHLPLKQLAMKHGDLFPRLRQATVLFGS